jgi:hypothetical protein
MMTDPITNPNFRAIQSYRQMAERCRKMAAVSSRPNSLLLRAESFEATALALERDDAPVSAVGD